MCELPDPQWIRNFSGVGNEQADHAAENCPLELLVVIGIVAALSLELSGIRRRIQIENQVRLGAHTIWEGRCRGHQVVLMQTGVGKARAEEAIDVLLARYPVSALLSIGFGGGVHPDLTCGDVVVCSSVDGATGGESPAGWSLVGAVRSDDCLQRLAAEALAEQGIRAHVGDALAVSRVIESSAQKAEIGRMFRVKVVDMESYWVARRALGRVSRLLVARAISDPIDYALPDFSGIVDADWNVGPRQVT